MASAPVFVTEWGYTATDPNSHAWGAALQATIDANGASWTAWVTDNAWSPPMFTSTALTGLTDFGTLTKTWLATKGPQEAPERRHHHRRYRRRHAQPMGRKNGRGAVWSCALSAGDITSLYTSGYP